MMTGKMTVMRVTIKTSYLTLSPHTDIVGISGGGKREVTWGAISNPVSKFGLEVEPARPAVQLALTATCKRPMSKYHINRKQQRLFWACAPIRITRRISRQRFTRTIFWNTQHLNFMGSTMLLDNPMSRVL